MPEITTSPDNAPSDRPNTVPLEDLPEPVDALPAFDAVAKGRRG